MPDEESLIDYAKQEELMLMYKSVDRMNQHIMNNNTPGVIAEQYLQQNFRKRFRDLQSRQGIDSDL